MPASKSVRKQNPGNASKASSTDKSKGFLELLALIYVLKNTTDKNNPRSIPEIAREMEKVLGPGKDYERNTRRIINEYLKIYDWEDMSISAAEKKRRFELSHLLYYVFCGFVKKISKGHPKYYFEPSINDSAMDMINGSIMSNMFFSDEEKDYLLSRLSVINNTVREKTTTDSVTEVLSGSLRPNTDDNALKLDFPGKTSRFFKNLNIIDTAIKNKYQIEMTYGIYGIVRGKLKYSPRKDQNGIIKYILNPYAHFWNNGKYYMVATYVSGHERHNILPGTPIGFRVDRIIDVELRKNTKDPKKGYEKRNNIPKRLSPFFIENKDDPSIKVFSSDLYVKAFPNMRISQKGKPITCKVECGEWAIQLLVDSFGSDLDVKMSKKLHINARDYNGKKETYVEVTIENVELENMRDFCLANPEYITPTEPKELVDAVRAKLEKILQKYPKTPPKTSIFKN